MNRRSFLLSALAAPVVIRTPGLLMPVKPVVLAPGTWEITTGTQLLVYLKNGWL